MSTPPSDFKKDLKHMLTQYLASLIKYKKGEYVDIIHKNDLRYNIITPIINKKIQILKTIDLRGSKFYFEFGFDLCK